jgi:hypothetical protein
MVLWHPCVAAVALTNPKIIAMATDVCVVNPVTNPYIGSRLISAS